MNNSNLTVDVQHTVPLYLSVKDFPTPIPRSPQKLSFNFWTAFAQKNLRMKVGNKD